MIATTSFVLPDNVESLSLFGSGLTGTANDAGNQLYGDPTFATTLIGGAGEDYIQGGAGNDTIEGGGGDLMRGKAGADTFVFKDVSDLPVVGALATIDDFSEGEDKIDLSGITTTGSGLPLSFVGTSAFSHQAGEVRQSAPDSETIVEGDVDGDGLADFKIQLTGPVTLQASDFDFTPACYRARTRLLTVRGEVAVENLTPGDRVVTASGDTQPIIWIGHRRVDCSRHREPRLAWPVRVMRGAFGKAQPHRDLYLSPDHAVFVDGLLIPVRHLINGTTIEQMKVKQVVYYHVELPHHDVLIAEGLAAESYLDTGNRGDLDTGDRAGVFNLHPAFGGSKARFEDSVAPLAVDEAVIRPIWERLETRSRALGFSVPERVFTDDPALHLRIGERVVRPLMPAPNCFTFILPAGFGPIRLSSRSGYPTDARPWLDDRRKLGVCLARIICQETIGPREIPLDHPDLTEGWWQVEATPNQSRRWTNGDALLVVPSATKMVRIKLAGALSYRITTADPNDGEALDARTAA